MATKYKPRIDHSKKDYDSADMAQDKKTVKKAFKMHDEQSHEGDKTDLSKLKKAAVSRKIRAPWLVVLNPAESANKEVNGKQLRQHL